uniref:Uncharacterized protein n=1 Tax=Arundo donax TaxID=35708 RepID=A0A0A8Y2N9_ARUDO
MVLCCFSIIGWQFTLSRKLDQYPLIWKQVKSNDR